MHISAQKFVYTLVPEGAKAGWIAERAAAFEVNPIDCLGGRVENQTEVVLALPQMSLGGSLSRALLQELEDQEALCKQ
jgi:hypothetical protein